MFQKGRNKPTTQVVLKETEKTNQFRILKIRQGVLHRAEIMSNYCRKVFSFMLGTISKIQSFAVLNRA